MADFKTEALHIVERNLASWKRDIIRDMYDCSYRINEGFSSRDDLEELETLRSEISILNAFQQVLDDIYKGV